MRFKVDENRQGILHAYGYSERKNKDYSLFPELFISSAPLRVSFSGGGTDRPEYFARRAGAVLSTSVSIRLEVAAFDERSVYNALLPAGFERVEENEITRAARSLVAGSEHIAIYSRRLPIHEQTGLGSSSAFSVALMAALAAASHLEPTMQPATRLAALAYHLERELCGRPIGKQDAYASAIGGLNFIRFLSSGEVTFTPIVLKPHVKAELEERLVLLRVGPQRDSAEILRSYGDPLSELKATTNQKLIELAEEMAVHLENGSLDDFGAALHRAWLLKQRLSSAVSSPLVDKTYNWAVRNGARGGKLLGAGGGGFLLLYSHPEYRSKLRSAFPPDSFLPFRFEATGVDLRRTASQNP